MTKLARTLLITCGTLCVALGFLGIFLPILPTTPFLLLAAVCFARSSDRLYQWLLNNPWFGEYIRNYREGRGLPLRLKILTILTLWLVIGSTALFVVSALWVRITLFAIMAGVTIHLVTVKTSRLSLNSRPADHSASIDKPTQE